MVEEAVEGVHGRRAEHGAHGAANGEIEPDGEAQQGAADHGGERPPAAQDAGLNGQDKERVGGEAKDRQRVVGDAEPGGERKQVEPGVAPRRPPAGQQIEIDDQEGAGEHMGVGVDGMLPDVGAKGEGEGGEDGGGGGVGHRPVEPPGDGPDGAVDGHGARQRRQRRQQVHAPGHRAQGDQDLDALAQQGEKGVAGRVGDAQPGADDRVFRRIAENGHAGQRGQVDGQDQQRGQRGCGAQQVTGEAFHRDVRFQRPPAAS